MPAMTPYARTAADVDMDEERQQRAAEDGFGEYSPAAAGRGAPATGATHDVDRGGSATGMAAAAEEEGDPVRGYPAQDVEAAAGD